MRYLVRFVFLPGALGAACAATTPGGNPHDMSAAAHEREAREHARLGELHAVEYSPTAAKERDTCTPGRASSGPNAAAIEGICWSSVHNPTEDHRLAAEQHRRHAADHRAASVALRDAEARACAGIAPDDRDMSPFEHGEDITSVTPLKLNEYDVRAGPRRGRLGGAVITFRAVPGLTAEWFQRVVNCHLARNAALGHSVPEMPDCPLVPRGVEARVSPAGDGFAVAIQSDDTGVAREILERAQRLASPAPRSPAASKQEGSPQ